MNYWLFKTEPDAFSIDDLANKKSKGELWDGVRNYQARNLLRDEVKKGDEVFIYHSSCKVPALVGIASVIKDHQIDDTQFDPSAKYYDPKSTPENPRWYAVTIKHKKTFKEPLPLKDMKQNPELAGMKLLQKGNRLSVMPVDKSHGDLLLKLLG
ncbi:MAG: EVE domain-containing protein [Pseudomonadales bacterium]|nr:EVE domain-containing protein [Pseudomonadales bacterium]